MVDKTDYDDYLEYVRDEKDRRFGPQQYRNTASGWV